MMWLHGVCMDASGLGFRVSEMRYIGCELTLPSGIIPFACRQEASVLAAQDCSPYPQFMNVKMKLGT